MFPKIKCCAEKAANRAGYIIGLPEKRSTGLEFKRYPELIKLQNAGLDLRKLLLCQSGLKILEQTRQRNKIPEFIECLERIHKTNGTTNYHFELFILRAWREDSLSRLLDEVIGSIN